MGELTVVHGTRELGMNFVVLDVFFSVQRPHGFRQVVQHVLFHVVIWD